MSSPFDPSQYALLTGVIDIKPLASTGIMSSAFTGVLDGRNVVITTCEPSDEQRLQRVWNKPALFHQLVKEHGIPFPRIYVSGFEKYRMFIVSARMNGEVAGYREIENGRIHDYCKVPHIHDELMELIAKIHSIPVRQFGYLVTTDGGTFASWEGFLTWQVDRCLTYLRSVGSPWVFTAEQEAYLRSIPSTVYYTGKPMLIHGDIINYGNILTDSTGITGILDVEWSLAGDPAYEFAFDSGLSLDGYPHDASFEMRKDKYAFIWLLWACTVHPRSEFGLMLYSMLQDKLSLAF